MVRNQDGEAQLRLVLGVTCEPFNFRRTITRQFYDANPRRIRTGQGSQRGTEGGGEKRGRCERESRDGTVFGVVLFARWRRTKLLDICVSNLTRCPLAPVLVEN